MHVYSFEDPAGTAPDINMNYSLPRPIFNVRVYGILIENGAVLVSDEVHHDRNITKFPGGGLQFGESTHECVQREFMEELQLEINVKAHFYTVDFFQPSAFDPTQQVISIYYIVESAGKAIINVSEKKFDFPERQNGTQSMRWIPVSKLLPEDFTFPIDQKVSGLLTELFSGNFHE